MTTPTVSERLVQIRQAAGRPIEEVAAGAHLAPERLAEIESGESAPTLAELQSLGACYGVDPLSMFREGELRLQDYAVGG